jgi:hypothetical protein
VIKLSTMGWVGHMSRVVEKGHAHRDLVWKPEGKRRLVRPRCIWHDEIKVDLQEIAWGTDWTVRSVRIR